MIIMDNQCFDIFKIESAKINVNKNGKWLKQRSHNFGIQEKKHAEINSNNNTVK